jgi:hypothetical protein
MRLDRLDDAQLLEELLVALTLGDERTAHRLTREVLRRDLVERAKALAAERTAQERRRRG